MGMGHIGNFKLSENPKTWESHVLFGTRGLDTAAVFDLQAGEVYGSSSCTAGASGCMATHAHRPPAPNSTVQLQARKALDGHCVSSDPWTLHVCMAWVAGVSLPMAAAYGWLGHRRCFFFLSLLLGAYICRVTLPYLPVYTAQLIEECQLFFFLFFFLLVCASGKER